MTVNCPNCGVGNHILPNMKKPKCRKCGKLIPSSGSPEKSEITPKAAVPAKAEKAPKPKTPKVPEKIEKPPETPEKEVRFVPDYEV